MFYLLLKKIIHKISNLIFNMTNVIFLKKSKKKKKKYKKI